jgi:pimeloyl-ACP methyl ester carboxylesterase
LFLGSEGALGVITQVWIRLQQRPRWRGQVIAPACLDALAPGERFVVAGVSYGGYAARGVIYRRRLHVDGVVLSAPAIEMDPAKRRVPPHQILIHDPAMEAALEPEEQLAPQVAVVQSLEYLQDFRAAIKPGILAADTRFLEHIDAQPSFSFAVDELPAPCPAPTLIVAGRQDSLCGYQDAVALLENFSRGTLSVLDRAGHGLATEQKRSIASWWANGWIELRSMQGRSAWRKSPTHTGAKEHASSDTARKLHVVHSWRI